jgi:hypothetical protein
MRTCYLHLGMNKAGSTSIQHVFRDYCDERVRYLRLAHLAPPYLDNGNHSHHLEMRFRQEVPTHFFSSPKPGIQRAERRRLRRDFDQAVSEAEESLIISGEVLYEWRDARTVNRAAKYLQARFDRVQGLVYVREPTGYMRSLVQQLIQMRAPDLETGFERFYPRYRPRLRNWEAALGRNRLDFIPFNFNTSASTDLLLDFASRMGANPDWVQRHQGPKGQCNPSLSAEAVSTLLRFRVAHGARPSHGSGRTADARLVSALMSFGHTRFHLHGAEVTRILEKYSKDRQWMERRLGQSLILPPADPREVGFSVWNDFMDYGAGMSAALTKWQKRTFPKIPVAKGTPEDILAGIRTALLEQWP